MNHHRLDNPGLHGGNPDVKGGSVWEALEARIGGDWFSRGGGGTFEGALVCAGALVVVGGFVGGVFMIVCVSCVTAGCVDGLVECVGLCLGCFFFSRFVGRFC